MSHHTKDPICPLCEEKLKDAHPALSEWFLKFVKAKFPEAHVSWTFRDEEDQNRFYLEGRTRCRFPNSKHNKKPSLAIDLFQLRDADLVAAWPKEWFREIADLTTDTYLEIPIDWGGRFLTLGDLDHFQLRQN